MVKYIRYMPSDKTTSAPSAPPEEFGMDSASLMIEPAPPVYEYVAEEPSVAPPTYESLLGFASSAVTKTTAKIKKSRKSRESPEAEVPVSNEFPRTIGDAIALCILMNLIWCSIPIAQIVVGYIYWDQCPLSTYIPISMVINGILWNVLGIIICQLFWIDNILKCIQVLIGYITGIVFAGAIGATFFGSFYVFYHFTHVDYNGGDDYCHKTLFLFAFGSFLIPYVLTGLVIVILVIVTLASVCKAIYQGNFI